MPDLASSRRWLARAPAPSDVLGLAVVVGAVLATSAWRVVDSETYMRLAIGRAQAGGFPETDPFLFSVPGLRWTNPEWLGDLLLYGIHTVAGEAGLVAFKLVALAVGWGLIYGLARRQGASPAMAVGLMLVALGAANQRFIERNELHAFWLIPVYGLLLEAARGNPRWLWALPPLGILWGSLHGSFVLGWVLVGAAFAEAAVGGRRDPRHARRLALVLLVHPLLPLVHPDGLAAYDLVLDHMRHTQVFRQVLSEWRRPALVPTSPGDFPFLLLVGIGLASFIPRVNRGEMRNLLVVLAGIVLAQGSQRFVLILGALAVPATAANLTRLPRQTSGQPRSARLVAGGLVLVGLALVAPVIQMVQRRPHAADRPDVPVKVARWLATHARPGSHLFAHYEGAQWFMWEAPALKLYIHPHLSFGGAFMLRFFRDILPRPEAFETEARRLGIDLAVVDMRGKALPLARHLDGAGHWRLIFLDGHFAVYARDVSRNAPVIHSFGYRVLRGRHALEYLRSAPAEALAPELARLRKEGPTFAGMVEAYRLLDGPSAAETPAARAGAVRASRLLETAAAELAYTDSLAAYRITARARAGDLDGARVVAAEALAEFPNSRRVRAAAGAVAPVRPSP